MPDQKNAALSSLASISSVMWGLCFSSYWLKIGWKPLPLQTTAKLATSAGVKYKTSQIKSQVIVTQYK